MQDLFGSVRRSIVFRPTAVDGDGGIGGGDEGNLVDKINSCIRKSRVFSKPSPPRLLQQLTTAGGNASAAASPIRWRRGELIGTGAFGQVYMGMNLDTGELLAVKQVLIPANNASKEKAQIHVRELEEEVKLLKNLSHPNIVRYLGTVREEETMNILLEFVPGGSIASLLGKFGSFPDSVIRMYTKQLLLGLHYLHQNGIMHRDIKGANILVDNRGCIKLADFGASKQVVELATVSGARSMKGTPYWMAPEVIRQTGHNFSADIWSVGCTVIEMATGKPPWSQQYKEIAAFIFHVGSTMEHPPIPDHLSAEARHFLSKCLQKEPGLRPSAFELLQHPFVNGEFLHSPVAINTTTTTELLEEKPLLLHGDNLRNISDSTDVCNLGTLDFSIADPEDLSIRKDIWGQENVDDDMCRIGEKDELMSAAKAKFSNLVGAEHSIKSFNPMCDSDDLRCTYEVSPEADEKNVRTEKEHTNDSFISRQTSLGDDDDMVTESKIQAFLHEKVLELKKLQTPLYEEYYNSFNPLCSPIISEPTGDQNTSKYLKLPPKSRSPSRTPSRAVDGADDASPGSSSRRVSHIGVGSSERCDQNSSAQANDVNDPQDTSNPTLPVNEIQRKWKEELDKELEMKREMMRQAGGVKTSPPNDRGLSRPRERSRFASPGK